MQLNVQMQIKNKKNYYNYLKENSFWIKELNRNPNNLVKFNEYIKEKYKLRVSDKISNAIDSVNLLSNVIDALK